MKKAAAIQMCSSHDIQINLKTAADLIAQSVHQHEAELIVLPEMFAIMGLKPEDKVKAKEPLGNGLIQDFLAEQAQKNQIWIIGGTIPIEGKSTDKIKATTPIYDSNGKLAAQYSKKHLFDANISEKETYRESETTEPGKTITVIPTPFGKLGLAICFDLRFPQHFSELKKQGAEIIAIPAAFTKKTGAAHWHLLTRCRAVENACYVIGAAQSGQHTNGRETYGHSLIVDPWGTVIQECPTENNKSIAAPINLDYLKELKSIFLNKI